MTERGESEGNRERGRLANDDDEEAMKMTPSVTCEGQMDVPRRVCR